jgi:hypothetical protein
MVTLPEGGAVVGRHLDSDGGAPADIPERVREPRRPSRRLLNTATRIAAAAAARIAGEEQVLGFTPRDFVIFGLPYKDPKTSLYVRRNGALTPMLLLVEDPDSPCCRRKGDVERWTVTFDCLLA